VCKHCSLGLRRQHPGVYARFWTLLFLLSTFSVLRRCALLMLFESWWRLLVVVYLVVSSSGWDVLRSMEMCVRPILHLMLHLPVEWLLCFDVCKDHPTLHFEGTVGGVRSAAQQRRLFLGKTSLKCCTADGL